MPAVLFDLDGTLVDTAPDLADALNQLRQRHHRQPLPFATIRPHVSHGGGALIHCGFADIHDQEQRETLRLQLLDIYQQNICQNSRLFHPLDELLKQLEKHQIGWGIVTNKPDWLSRPLLAALNLDSRCSVLVCGNTLSQKKPHPLPLLHACQQINTTAKDCIYIGDARRDIEAARAAKMPSVAAGWGYIEDSDPASAWAADYLLTDPSRLWPLIKTHFNIAGQ